MKQEPVAQENKTEHLQKYFYICALKLITIRYLYLSPLYCLVIRYGSHNPTLSANLLDIFCNICFSYT